VAGGLLGLPAAGGGMYVLGLVFLLALMIEAVVEYFLGPIFDTAAWLKPYKWALMYVAAVVGILGCWIYQFDIMYLMGGYLSIDGGFLQQPSPFGIVLTGLTVGRGSNAVHDLIMRFVVLK
jgi:hypothetical protein